MCGKEARLFKTDVEGSMLSLCNECSKFGKVISVVREEKKEKRKEVKAAEESEEEIILSVVAGYGEVIKKKREKLGIKQEDFAKEIKEKVSLVHKIETNHFEPSISLARKIEKFLHIKLIEQEKIEKGSSVKEKSEGFTIGDFIKVKK